MIREASQTRALLDDSIYIGSHALISLRFMLIKARKPIKLEFKTDVRSLVSKHSAGM